MIVTFTAWQYDPKFHALIGPIAIAPEHSAGGELVYRVPACATLVEPPDEPPGQKAVWLDSTQQWFLVSDHRGERWFDYMGRPVTIERLGDPAHWDMRRDPHNAQSSSGQ